MGSLFIASSLKRFLLFLLADIGLIWVSLCLSFLDYYELNLNIGYLKLINQAFFCFVVVKLLWLASFRVYKITWRFIGISDVANIFLATLIAELMLVVLSLPNRLLPNMAILGLSKRIFFIDGIVSFGLISTLRVSKRLYLEMIRERRTAHRGDNTLIIGAGNVGEMILRDIARNNFMGFYPIGFLDDDPTKIGSCIHGVKVLRKTDKLAEVIFRYQVQAVIIAIPTLNHKMLRSLYDGAKNAGVKTIKIVPQIYDCSRPDINMKTLECISIEDLVGRQSISVDGQGIRKFIRGKSILVTGAGGSIGSEIVVQICAYKPEQMILFDIDETELHNLGLKLQRLFPHLMKHIAYVTGDIRDELRLREVFDAWQPQIVFHAAGYKHVPMMEYNPKEAVKVNIFGTFAVASVAKDHGVEKFIMISTDKAVRPTSVMGATKRIAEFICGALNEDIDESNNIFSLKEQISRIRPNSHPTQFISVRFGNVLGSRGSVVPLFLEQLRHGGPLTVTHREVKRYFMTIPEAVSLVLQATILGNGGEVFVLDMGDPVKIINIAEELIRIHGMEPYKDIDIQITELRPGEKLFEEILTAEEGTDASLHKKIFIARNGAKYPLAKLPEILKEFSAVIADPLPGSDDRMKQLLKKYIKYYQAPGEIGDASQVLGGTALEASKIAHPERIETSDLSVPVTEAVS